MNSIKEIRNNWMEKYQGITPMGLVDLTDLSKDILEELEAIDFKKSPLPDLFFEFTDLINEIENRFYNSLGSIALFEHMLNEGKQLLRTQPSSFPKINEFAREDQSRAKNFTNVSLMSWQFLKKTSLIVENSIK